MFATVGQYVGGKVLTAILIVSSAGAGFYFYKNPEQLENIWQIIKYAITWIGFVLVLPWATFFVTPWVVKQDTNLAAGLMLAGYLFVDAIFAFYLMGGLTGHGSLTWAVILLGLLSAAVYNFMACEYQAQKASGDI